MASFLSNIFKLTTGTMVAQMTGILLIPVITRIYSPEFFGVAQIFLSIAAVLLVVSSLSYNYVIMLPERDEDSMNVFMLCIVCVLGTSTVTGAVIIGFSDWFGAVFEMAMIADYLIWLPIFVGFNSLFVILNGWLSRKVKYGVLSRGIVVNSVSTRVFQIGSGLIVASPMGLIFGSMMGLALSNLFMFRGLKEDVGLIKTVTIERMKGLAIRYKEFPIYGSTASLANSMSWELPAFMLAYYFNPTVLGYYALAIMAVKLPMAMVGTAISQVFYQKASEEMNQTGGVKTVVREVHTRLIAIGIFPFIIFIILAEDLFTFAFGVNWLTAGTYAQILAPWLFAVFIVSPISTLFSVLEKQRILSYFEFMTLCTWILVFYVGGASGNPLLTLALFSVCGMLIWGAKSVYLIRESGAGYRSSMLSLTRHLLLSIIISLPLVLGVYIGLPLLLLFGIAGITAVVYYLVIFFTDTMVRNEIMGMVQGLIPSKHTDWMERLGPFR
ncbi:lipopolysaccharide biosynthesis protein [Methanoculleus sp. UBA303]|jgi:O-antigen/teichoic acid export membrane protein|uniref:lipopolysaccharide biosynthesis protein n=1 Tax=Methanoculleus sp. UBA303 TaxID=1915497 RepID=UPI0025DD4EEB|nr:lipopolysaccharide biosynthesis protein [Methanoculleus sp. UBA303]